MPDELAPVYWAWRACQCGCGRAWYGLINRYFSLACVERAAARARRAG